VAGGDVATFGEAATICTRDQCISTTEEEERYEPAAE
jgi:hypothetical protein